MKNVNNFEILLAVCLSVCFLATIAAVSAADARKKTNERFRLATEAGLECTQVITGLTPVAQCVATGNKRE